ncbi:MAG: leucine--tRNA ligase [Methanomassiliicoccaceae archaeon]|nr:leucine--tRNA ligase [Methanomassiliicoccaceae archaeon]
MASYRKIEDKWQRKWSEIGLEHADRDENPKKFMIVFAYPGVTGYLHVGHMRGYTYADAIGRYKRMTGHNVLFPVGTHATGNGAITLAHKIARKDKETIDYLKRNGCTDGDLKKMKDPVSIVEFFNNIYVNDYWKRFGFIADWRKFTCTLYPDYQKFIQWQFMKLNENSLLIQKPYFAAACTECGPVAIDASETDISKGGNAETQEYTLLKFKCNDLFLIAATLRPETVYGQVNFWVNPDVEYVKMKKDDETWIVSPQAAEKLMYQKDGCEIIGSIKGKDMAGWVCEAPMIRRNIPIFPAKFCDPDVGTGLVTSVPSDAPDDWISLHALKNDLNAIKEYGLTKEQIDSAVPVSIISMDGYGEFPAKDIIEMMSIEAPGDPKLIDAKKQVYKDGHHTGRMKDICGEFAGLRVEEAKERMRTAMTDSGEAELFYDLSEEVICRCGSRVMIRRVDDQWFIDYSNEELTKRTSEHCRKMEINPVEYQNNVHGVLNWFRERACVRQGNWLGTKFPFDERWTVEAISDSTLYPVYYIISMYANNRTISPDQMTESFFDHVILGKKEPAAVSKETGISKDILEKIRKDVEYWYPLDLNLGGKEHMTVHFPTFLFNHAAIFSEDRKMLPRGIMVHWYITGKKSKISKSKGGAQPIPGAAEEFGVDALRLYYAHVASPFSDVEWDEDIVMSYRQRLEKITVMVEELNPASGKTLKGTEKTSDIDVWIISMFSQSVLNMHSAMERFGLRQMASETYFEMFGQMKRYLHRGGCDPHTIRDALKMWISAMAPITPHIAEELWSVCGFEGIVSKHQLPQDKCLRSKIDLDVIISEKLIDNTVSDILQLYKANMRPKNRVIIYTTPEWKKEVERKALSMLKKGERRDASALIKECMADPSLQAHRKDIPDFIKKMDIITGDRIIEKEKLLELDEYGILSSASAFISKEIGTEAEVVSADDPGRYDPRSRSGNAKPGRPALYFE